MTAMNSNKARAHALRGEEVNFTEEARRIQSKALGGQACVVRLGQVVFFSSESGDAWMLDPEDGYAVCLVRDFELRHIPIQETPAKLAIEWNADYKIEGEGFTVMERRGSIGIFRHGGFRHRQRNHTIARSPAQGRRTLE